MQNHFCFMFRNWLGPSYFGTDALWSVLHVPHTVAAHFVGVSVKRHCSKKRGGANHTPNRSSETYFESYIRIIPPMQHAWLTAEFSHTATCVRRKFVDMRPRAGFGGTKAEGASTMGRCLDCKFGQNQIFWEMSCSNSLPAVISPKIPFSLRLAFPTCDCRLARWWLTGELKGSLSKKVSADPLQGDGGWWVEFPPLSPLDIGKYTYIFPLTQRFQTKGHQKNDKTVVMAPFGFFEWKCGDSRLNQGYQSLLYLSRFKFYPDPDSRSITMDAVLSCQLS